MMFSLLLIANRGAVACRVVRTVKRLVAWTIERLAQDRIRDRFMAVATLPGGNG